MDKMEAEHLIVIEDLIKSMEDTRLQFQRDAKRLKSRADASNDKNALYEHYCWIGADAAYSGLIKWLQDYMKEQDELEAEED